MIKIFKNKQTNANHAELLPRGRGRVVSESQEVIMGEELKAWEELEGMGEGTGVCWALALCSVWKVNPVHEGSRVLSPYCHIILYLSCLTLSKCLLS